MGGVFKIDQAIASSVRGQVYEPTPVYGVGTGRAGLVEGPSGVVCPSPYAKRKNVCLPISTVTLSSRSPSRAHLGSSVL